MAVVRPFRGLTYNFSLAQEFSKLVAPPYDVISEDQQERYYQAHPNNVIRLILGKKKTGDTDLDNRYTRAADYLRRWESDGLIVRASEPAIYLTSLTYRPQDGDRERTRWGFIALTRIEEEDSGVILPHERTFSAHKDDRLKLLRTCNTQFSQIFGLYEDEPNEILEACKEYADQEPVISFQFEDGTAHSMWILKNPSLFRKVSRGMRDKTIFIADGHHRYETSRNFRNIMRARYGRRNPDRSYEFVMMYLTNMNDEGLTILPSHRLIRWVPDFNLHSFLEKASTWFNIDEQPFGEADYHEKARAIERQLATLGKGRSVIGFYPSGSNSWYVMTLREEKRKLMGDDLHPSLKQLDVLVLSRFLFQKALGFSRDQLDDEENFHYQSSLIQALASVDSGNHQMAFFLNPTKMEQVKEVARNFLVMPRKSTYFYPKVITGLVFNKIDPHETIEAF
ncbi:MAG: hypothetical protein DRH12_07940 [Deltaproteobacteria bacterium]|nr:MAG: hypothetical protein DRH12_07940 [Deltaproteobacteria bacterium]